jgi:sterol desaturase/sphingolipid hydroxylase (fatty acid hydroxylase superfamily)
MDAFVPVFLTLPVFIGLEFLWGRRRGQKVYDWRESWATLGIIAGMRFSRLAALPFTLALYTWLAGYAPVALPSHVGTFLVALVISDFVYYWYHRFSHELPVLWAIHQTHHTPEHMNLLAAGRLNWLGPWLVQPVLGIPLVFLGFPPLIVAAVSLTDLLFQFFLHTEAIPRLRWLEGWVNTPAAHRFHHARNEGCLDVNYAGVFTVWDRLFGTWVEPDLPVEALQYGLTSGPQGHNPVWLVFGGLVRWVRREPI